MARPDFTKIWAGSRPSIPEISGGSYAAGWDSYLGPLPPLGDDHDYVMNLQDQRAVWLAGAVDPLRIDVASAATVDLVTLAPDTRAIRITGTSAIGAFTILAGQRYVVTAGGNFTLTSGASIVTNSGQDLALRSGDSFEIIAISDNVVAVLLHSFGVHRRLASMNGYRIIEDGTANPIVIQWGAQTNSGLSSGTITYPLGFNNTAWAVVATAARVSPGHTIKTTITGGANFTWEALNLSGAGTAAFTWIAIGQ